MRKFPVVLSLFLLASTACAKEYGTYDLQRLLTATDTPTGKQRGFDVTYLDRMLGDLSLHALGSPAKFDTPQDRQRAIKDVAAVSKMLDILISAQASTPNKELLWRAGLLNSMGNNMGIAGAGEKADAVFRKMLAVAPADPRGNYLYGLFLTGAGKPKEALPHLEKALSLGVTDATYSTGMAYLALGDKEKALANLRAYKSYHANDTAIDIIVEGVSSGKFPPRNEGAQKGK